MLQQRVQRGPDLADLGPLVGEVVGYPLGQLDLTLGHRDLRDPVRRVGDLAQRPQLAAYDERAHAARGDDGEQPEQQLQPDQRRDGVVDVLGRQSGHDGRTVADLGGGHPVGADIREVHGVEVAVGRQVGQDGERLRRHLVGLAAIAAHDPPLVVRGGADDREQGARRLVAQVDHGPATGPRSPGGPLSRARCAADCTSWSSCSPR